MRARLRRDHTAAQVDPPLGLTGMAVHNTGRDLYLVRNLVESSALRYLVAGLEVGDSVVDPSGRVALGGQHAKLRNEAVGDLKIAHAWHMRAATWSINRDMAATRRSWQRARDIADRLPADDPERGPMRIAPRTVLCASAWRAAGSGTDAGFEELRELCEAEGDRRSLAIGMAGHVMTNHCRGHRREASQLASEHIALLDAIGDPTLTIAASWAALSAKWEVAEMTTVLRFAQRVIDLADDDATKGALVIGSPLAYAIAAHGDARSSFGIASWRSDFDKAIDMARAVDSATLSGVHWFTHVSAIPHGATLPDAAALRDTDQTLRYAERSGDGVIPNLARTARGITLIHLGGADRHQGLQLLTQVRELSVQDRFCWFVVPLIDIHIAHDKAMRGDFDAAVELSRAVVEELFDSGGWTWSALATTVLVESLLRRDVDGDVDEAQSAIDRLADAPVDPGFVFNELPLLRLRALLARAHGDEPGYREFRDKYRKMATDLGFEGHIAMAEAMP
jgi:adenylate cyclase